MKTLIKHALRVSLLGLTLIMASCGESNSSGNSSSQATDPTVNPASGTGVPGSVANIVANEIGCATGGQRQAFQIQAPVAPNTGNSHVGVSTFGDIAELTGTPGNAILTLYLCPRQGWTFTNQPQLYSRPEANYSTNCRVGEITSLVVAIGVQMAGGGGGYYGGYGYQQTLGISFAPVNFVIPQTQLCSGPYNNGGRYYY